MGAPIEIGRDEARRRAEEELAKAKYHGIPDWISDVVRRISELVDRVLSPVLGGPGAGGAGWVLLVVVLVVVVALVLIVWRVGLPRWRRRIPDAEVGLDDERAPQEYRGAADRAAAQGDWTDAIRERFRALVRELEHRTVIDPRPGRTALEAAGAAARLMPAVEPSLRTAASLFNDVMYGSVTADEGGYRTMVTADDAIRAEAARFRHPEPDGHRDLDGHREGAVS